jgi:hypothetical protein
VGVTGDGAATLAQLRALPPEKLLEGVSAQQTLAALAAGTTPAGMQCRFSMGNF